MKQNFQLHYFYGENENAIRTQVWCTLIAQLLLTVLQKKEAAKKAFSTVATLVRIHLVSMLDVYELLKNTSRSWVKAKTKKLLFLPCFQNDKGGLLLKINTQHSKINTFSRQKLYF